MTPLIQRIAFPLMEHNTLPKLPKMMKKIFINGNCPNRGRSILKQRLIKWNGCIGIYMMKTGMYYLAVSRDWQCCGNYALSGEGLTQSNCSHNFDSYYVDAIYFSQ